jgi:hypothetical protein
MNAEVATGCDFLGCRMPEHGDAILIEVALFLINRAILIDDAPKVSNPGA